ncbi:MAG: BamA/OMP85 family outer membrane protein [Gemmatimonadota bacterium]
MRRAPRLAAAAALVLAAPVAAQQPEVVELRFEGNRTFDQSELASAIVTRQSECTNPVYQLLLLCWIGVGVEPATLEPGALEADAFRIRVYYFERGFREAEVRADTTMAAPGEVRVTFNIDEGRPVRVEAVEMEGLPASMPERGLPLESGDLLDVVAYEATRDTLQARLRNAGYPRAQVLLGYSIRSEAPYEATVRYDVYAGTAARFGEIRVEGTEEATPRLVRRMLAFQEGTRYSRRALLQSQRNLYGLQIFRFASVDADLEASPDTLVPVAIRVAEGNMHQVRLGAGANNVECLNLEGRWTSRNFLGDGRRLSLRGRVGNLFIEQCDVLVNDDYTSYTGLTGLASVDFTQPWFFGPRNSVGIGLFAERRNVPDVFVRSALGGYLSVSRSMGGNAALTLAYRPELTELSTEGDLFFCVNFVACTFESVEILREPHWLAPVTLSYTIDQTDAVFTPSRGYIVRLDVEHAESYTGSDFSYTRLLGESSQYVGEQGGLVLATRFRGGVGIPHGNGSAEALGLNPQKRFFAGGANSVRGFDQFRLGPTLLGIDAVPWLVNGTDPTTEAPDGAGCTREQVNTGVCDPDGLPDRRFDLRPSGGEVLVEGSIELRFPLPFPGGNLRGAVFVDAGQVWAEREQVDLRDVVATPGFGLRYHSPIGPLRVDAAFNPRGPRSLTVLTTEVAECQVGSPGCRRVEDTEPRAFLRNTDNVVVLDEPVTYGTSLDAIDSVGDFFRRFQFHFSIGQAF